MAVTLDYKDGVDPDEFFTLYQSTIKRVAERKKDQVENFVIALGSLFDKKVLKTFNRSIEKIVGRLEGLTAERNPNPYTHSSKKPLSKMSKEERRAAMSRTMTHLNTLTGFIRSGGKIAPEGFG